MNLLQKTTAAAGATLALLAFSDAAYAQRTGNPGEPAPHCCDTTPPVRQPRPRPVVIHNDPTAIAAANAAARARANASATGGVATVGDTRTGDVNIRTTVAPSMALSGGWCMRGLSVSFGVNAFAGGISGADFSETCGRWSAIGYGAANVNCLVGMTSVGVASGLTFKDAADFAVNKCPMAFVPKN